MTTRVEHVVSEVVPQPEPSESEEQSDDRWTFEDRVAATMARQERLKWRVAAEGFDD